MPNDPSLRWKRMATRYWSAFPIIRLLLIVLLMGTCFTTSMLLTIGPEFIGVVDQTSVLILLAFYAAGSTVLINMLWAAGRTFVHPVLDAFNFAKRSFYRLMGREYRKSNNDIRMLVAAVIASILAFAFLWITISTNQNVIYIPGVWATLFAGVLSCVFLWIGYVHLRDSEHMGDYCRHFSRYLLLGTALLAGNTYVDYLLLAAPTIIVEFRDPSEPNREATVVAPATDGVIVFFRGNASAHYVPWSEIKVMRGHQVNNGTTYWVEPDGSPPAPRMVSPPLTRCP